MTTAILLAAAAFAGTPDLLLLSSKEASIIRAAIREGSPEAKSAAARLRASADRALERGPWSVTYHRPKNTPAGAHDFFSEGPYWWPDPKNPKGPYIRRDGEVNPERFIENDRDLEDMSEAVLRLGAAAYFFEESRYARRAAQVLSVWFLDEQTRMNPNLEFGQAIRGRTFGRGIGIIDTRPLIWAVQGASFLEQTSGWDRRVSEGVRSWFRDYLKWLTTSEKGLDEKKNGNNHSTWWAAQVAAYAGYAGDKQTQRMVWELFRSYLVPDQLRPDGSAPLEEARTKSLGYSAMNLDAFTMICRLASHSGEDLWRFRAPNGASVERAVEYLRPYVLAPAKWSKPQITRYEPPRNYFLAFAGIGLGRPEYAVEQKKWGAPPGAWGDVLALLLATTTTS